MTTVAKASESTEIATKQVAKLMENVLHRHATT